MDFQTNNLSTAATQSLHLASKYAAEYRTMQIEPEHLLLALLRTPGTLARKSLEALNADPDALADRLQGGIVPVNRETESRPTPSPALQKVLQYAAKEASHLGSAQIDSSHLLIGTIYEGAGPSHSLLQSADISIYDLREQSIQLAQQGVRETGQGGTRRASPQATWARRKRDDSFVPSPIFLIPVAIMVAAGAALYMGVAERGTSQVKVLTTLFVVAGWVVSLCLHEFGHALTGYLGGDTSVREKGYLTLNPLRYTHPVLSIVLPVIFLLLGGIGLPGGAVYIDRSRLRSGLWDSLVSAAGPLFSLIFAGMTALPFFFNWEDLVTQQNVSFWPALAFLAFIEASVVILNLLPIPPLDGFGIIAPLLSHEIRVRAYALGNMMFLLLFFVLLRSGPVAEAYRDGVSWLTELLRIPNFLVGEGFRNVLTLSDF
jgi:Zn-dependent protease